LSLTYELPTVDDTRRFGEALAAVLHPGDLVVLAGPLGAGKTVVAQGIGAGLRVTGAVTSPTFVIARVHRPDPARGGRVPLVHVDAYRLGTVTDPRAEVDDLDLDAVVEESVVIVEWGEGMVEHLADAHLLVRMDRRDDEVRVVELIGRGGDWPRRLTEVDSVSPAHRPPPGRDPDVRAGA
jgi:tRNA threonylcarbamoyladenosine biosynthesis protein TsaE